MSLLRSLVQMRLHQLIVDPPVLRPSCNFYEINSLLYAGLIEFVQPSYSFSKVQQSICLKCNYSRS